MKSAPIIAVLMLTATSGAALANQADARMREQRDWIEAGRSNGSITWREGRKLRREQAAISRIEAGMAADGRLSRHERRTLRHLQDSAQNDIVRQSSDRWRRPWWLPRFGY